MILSGCPVLIETLWNVKVFCIIIRSSVSGINRNIVECKEPCAFDIRNQVVCINRNIVECKDHQRYGVNGTADVLIETLWNVKTYWINNAMDLAIGINRNIVECKEWNQSCNNIVGSQY